MDTDRRNSTKRIIFMKKAKDFFNKQIEKEEHKLERKLTREERKENIKKNHKRAKLIAIVGTSFILGVGAGVEGKELLDSGKTITVAEKSENSVTIDSEEIGKTVRVNNARKVFVNGLYIGEDELEVVKNMNHDLEINTRREVDMLQAKPEQVLTYIKTLLANEYNQANGTNIASNDITEIYRKKAKEYDANFEDDKLNIITVAVNKKDKEETKLAYEQVRGNYVKAPIYFASIYENGQEILEKLLPVIDKGLDWIDEEARDDGSKQLFFESILKYKISKMNEIATERMELDNENEGSKKENQDENYR